jgi:hypothetical protein
VLKVYWTPKLIKVAMHSRLDITLADVLTDEQYRALQKRATEFQSAKVAGKSDIVKDSVDQIERGWQGDAVFDRETIEGVSALCSQIAGPFSQVLSLFANSCTLKLDGRKGKTHLRDAYQMDVPRCCPGHASGRTRQLGR